VRAVRVVTESKRHDAAEDERARVHALKRHENGREAYRAGTVRAPAGALGPGPQVGPVPVGFGLMAPAGVYAAGVAFTLRDVVQRALGRHAAVLAILAGAGASYLISPRSRSPPRSRSS
jgi:hypothetical protein